MSWFPVSPEMLRSLDKVAASFAAACLGLCALTLVLALAGAPATRHAAGQDVGAVGDMAYTVDDWNGFASQLTNERFWKKRGGGKRNSAKFSSLQRSGLTRAPDAVTLWGGTSRKKRGRSRRNRGERKVAGSVRTVCVRLCDGYFWPVSPNSSQRHIEDDRQICENSCTAPTKLFAAGTPTGSIDTFSDLSGRPYSAMRNAGAYTRGYTPSCKCHEHPWEAASRRRHEMYADLKRSGKLKRYLAKLSRDRRRLIGKRTRVASLGGGLSVAPQTRSKRVKPVRPKRRQERRQKSRRAASVTRTAARSKRKKRWRRDWSSQQMRLGATNRRTTKRKRFSRRRDLRKNPFSRDR